ncbi:tetrathionate reductase subunit C, partial [Staphylococcus aureus]
MIPQFSQIQEVIAIPQEYFWLPWAVQCFFFIGIACS